VVRSWGRVTSVGRVFLAIFVMAVSPVLSLENPLGVGLTATSNFNRDRDYATNAACSP